jgi:hypothetical protein
MNALINTYLVKESAKIQIRLPVMEVVCLKFIIGIVMENVLILINLAMGFAITQDKHVAKNVLILMKIKSGNAMVNVNPIMNLAMECAQQWEM